MAEIVEMKEHMVAMNNTESKTTKMKILDEQVVVALEITKGHKEGLVAGNANTAEGAPQGGHRENN